MADQVVAHVRRSINSIELYGPNEDILIRPDAQIFVVQTTLGYLMTYSLATDHSQRVYKAQFVNSVPNHVKQQSMAKLPVGPNGIPIGPGEADGVKEYSLQFRMVIKVDAGIKRALALDDELMVATVKPAAIQCIRWTPDASGSQTTAELLSRMAWMQKKVVVTDMIYDRPMNLAAWITSDGRAYAVQKQNTPGSDRQGGSFRGYCFHEPKNGGQHAVKVCIDARFSMIAVGCANGSIMVYVARDYNGNIPLSHTSLSPSASAGAIQCLASTPDGHCLFAGYEHGWATWSVYGKPGANSFHASTVRLANKPNEAYLLGVKAASWISNGGELLMLQSRPAERIWCLEFAKASAVHCLSSVSASQPILQVGERMFVYRTHSQNDLTTISQDTSVLWGTVQIPASYLSNNWPIRISEVSPDGRYVAVAGQRGLAHYSVNSGRWKGFTDPAHEDEFVVRGGMCWFQHILVASVETDDAHEIRLYSRELPLTAKSSLHTTVLSSPVAFLTLTAEDSLLVYTYSNVLYHFIIQATETAVASATPSVRLVQVGQITFHGIIHSPARVRSISWIVPSEQLASGDPSRDVSVATVIFLVDGKLVLLQPSTSENGDLKYDMRVLLQKVEWYILSRDHPPEPFSPYQQHPLADALWIFDGRNILLYPQVQPLLDAILTGSDFPSPVKIFTDFYPLTIVPSKALVLGLESDLVQRRDTNFAHFRFITKTTLFLAPLLRHALQGESPTMAQIQAMELARPYEALPYFPHALEMLLHSVLEEEMDSSHSSSHSRTTSLFNTTSATTLTSSSSSSPPLPSLLQRTISYLRLFPDMYLDIVVRCARKTEVSCWPKLFEHVGDPRQCFEEALEKTKLSTAGGFLLVMEELRGEYNDHHHDEKGEGEITMSFEPAVTATGGGIQKQSNERKSTHRESSTPSDGMVGKKEVERLMKRAIEEGEWEVCRELARFLVAVDNRGSMLREVVSGIQAM
ncbi:hypothetical protein EX30DRAFT_11061 [Ascodesmis nigricans]|uniref:RIC1 C-terminal alpha solenoid region domain-containing protein n=1 Tax=Ascodesmis nigricans TaxID=341454 RepID=A0A4S2N6F9_9PEZI|nr:hypothetical protein EX30DRAFT_11061 [Ascodesmis nigricans]